MDRCQVRGVAYPGDQAVSYEAGSLCLPTREQAVGYMVSQLQTGQPVDLGACMVASFVRPSQAGAQVYFRHVTPSSCGALANSQLRGFTVAEGAPGPCGAGIGLQDGQGLAWQLVAGLVLLAAVRFLLGVR